MEQQAESLPLTVVAIGHPRPRTWYYGMRCACQQLLCLCEDLFPGQGGGALLPLPTPLEVRCPCGRATSIEQLQRFRTP